ncbi:MAG TPA: ester cyclase [Dehalococcoidia bacterium]|nr:ester cyclase [Dehalococcoidia bacterium]
MSEEAKQLVRSIFAELDSAQSGEPFRKYGADNYVAHVPGMPPLDREGMVHFGSAFYQAFPGLNHEILEAISEGDNVSVRLRISGKHDGPLAMPAGTVPPTGRAIAWDAQNVIHVSGGKVVEHWLSMDTADMMRQLGLMG